MTGNSVNFRNFTALVFYVFAKAGTNQDSTDQCGDTADGVDRGGTCEIVETKLRKPALRVPNPTGFNGVNKQRNDAGVNAIGDELRALCHGAGYDGGCRCAEHKVEYEGRSHSVLEEPTEIGEDLKIRNADKSAYIILGHHEREAEQYENNRTDTEIHEVLHDDVAGIFRTGETGLNHGEPGLHEEHECGSDQEPDTKSFFCDN